MYNKNIGNKFESQKILNTVVANIQCVELAL